MIIINQGGVEVHGEAIPRLKEEFERTGIAMLPGFLSPSVLAPLLKNLETVSWEEKHEIKENGDVFGTTFLVPFGVPLLTSLYFILNRTLLFETVKNITNCSMPRNYFGRIHKTRADNAQHIDWHDDIHGSRVLGLNINLSRNHFEGGIFQLRDPDGKVRREVQEWTPGDAFLFRLAPRWQHRLTRVKSGERIVGVGWFRTEPDWNRVMLDLKSGFGDLTVDERI
jgi:2OG-Fe(II) oxygenase superfamily